MLARLVVFVLVLELLLGAVGLQLATVLHCTLPTRNALPRVGCPESPVPLRDLSELRLYGWPRWSRSAPELLGRWDVHGRAGQRDSITIELAGVWTVFVTTVDSAGNESCASNLVTVGGTVDVGAPVESMIGLRIRPQPVQRAAELSWYQYTPGATDVVLLDLAGRRVGLLDSRWRPVGKQRLDAELVPPAGLYWIGIRQGGSWVAGTKVVVLR